MAAAKKNPTTVANQPAPKFFPNPPASTISQALANSKKQVDSNK
jgi:hypothetical protein